jgi:pyrroline-5-carboxylate reductase
MLNKNKFLLIGYGNMGSSFVHPLNKLVDLTVIDPINRPNFECTYLSSISELSGNFDYIIFAVKPFQLMQVLGDFKSEFLHSNSRVISLIAGAKSNVYHQALGDQVKVSLAMANLPVRVGKGVTAIYSDEKLEFLDYLGQTIYVGSEDEIGKYFIYSLNFLFNSFFICTFLILCF